MKIITIIFTFLFINSLAYADKNMKIGSKGDETDVTRVIKVVMYDNYYEPSSFQIKEGETVKFEVENAGMLVHEFNIANKMMHMKHQPEMIKMAENGILLAFSIDKEKMKKMATLVLKVMRQIAYPLMSAVLKRMRRQKNPRQTQQFPLDHLLLSKLYQTL